MQQTTIARSVEWRGLGLHSGRPARVTVLPAAPDTGLVFRTPCEGGTGDVLIPARAEHVHSTTRATTLAARANGESTAARRGAPPVSSAQTSPAAARVATVEHLLAALFALGIHNAEIEVEGGEVPVLDGSAAPFVTRLRRAGIRPLAAARRELEVRMAFEVGDADRWIRVEPGDGLSIEYAIEFAHPVIGRQRFVLEDLDGDRFERELAAARTFGFADEVERLRAQGLAQGGDLSNTLVLGEGGLLNEGPLRWPDEFVRHKVVDLLGDLALIGSELHARITVEKGGHGLHHALVRALVERPGLLAERAPLAELGRLRAFAQPG
ncbi:MAG: UDP-3-O-[3-hydroxymyristoyl] N-acetylglucosamine deacetylase [Deltaproteobacteria bacterium]|nr:UDP-3-O-[3-hydroxymyristoyl] N-acetylglucosamine deacetylase [Deltaproteobacteria bacterium]